MQTVRRCVNGGSVSRVGRELRCRVSSLASNDGTQGGGWEVGQEPLSESLRGRVPKNIWEKTGRNLHRMNGHPLNTLRIAIEGFIEEEYANTFTKRCDLSPIVSTKDCFDDLLVPHDHVSRRACDTYYITDDSLLRTHMTAHDASLLRAGVKASMVCGDVYRRDSIDRTHYPVFHQVDAYHLYDRAIAQEEIEYDLKRLLEKLAQKLFGKQTECKWTSTYFPFTKPSFELEVRWKGEWLEVLGCGLLHRGVLNGCGIGKDVNGWAFGLGLERLAMILFDIPDIRLFWSRDERFLTQFSKADLTTKFRPFSVYPSIEKHVSFWIDVDTFHENDLHQVVRSTCGDLVESVRVIDIFEKNGRLSKCFAIVFRSMDKNLTHAYVNQLYDELRRKITDTLPVTLR